MFLFIDGEPVILDFQQVEQLYYQAFIAEFGQISITQWRGSYEYQCSYPAIQLMTENGTITQDAINEALQTIADINEEIKRPAVLHSRVSERFAEAGYVSTIRIADITTKGIMAICVDYTATQVTRSMTVGNDALLGYGYTATYGTIDNADFEGDTITEFYATSDYTLPVILSNLSATPFTSHPVSIVINVDGYGAATMTWNATNMQYELADNALADFIVAADTTAIALDIVGDYDTDPTQDTEIANLIVKEMLPAGQHMEGDISHPVVIGNSQSVLAKWSAPTQNDVDFIITLTVDRNSPYPVDTVDDIVANFLSNFNEQNKLGNDITPASYYQIERDAPWSSSIVVTYDLNHSGIYTGDIYSADYKDKFNATLVPVNVIIVSA